MPNKLTITVLASALALVGLPGLAFDLPDSGSKNFSPSGDTPSYFSNESTPVSARTADTTPHDWSAVDALVPERPAAPSAPAAQQGSGRHGKYALAQRSGRHASAKSGGKGQSTRFPKASTGRVTKSASVHYAPAQTRTPSKKPVWAVSAKSTAKGATPGGTKTTTAKHGKASTRHARADISIPAIVN